MDGVLTARAKTSTISCGAERTAGLRSATTSYVTPKRRRRLHQQERSRDGLASRLATLGCRVFWLLAAVSHLPALARLWQFTPATEAAATSVGQSALLTVAILFCALKALDVRFLRIRPCWRARVGLALALVLAHAGVISEFDPHPGLQAILSVGGSFTAVWLCARPALRSADRKWAARASAEFERIPLPAAWDKQINPVLEYLIPAYAGPRAPPRI